MTLGLHLNTHHQNNTRIIRIHYLILTQIEYFPSNSIHYHLSDELQITNTSPQHANVLYIQHIVLQSIGMSTKNKQQTSLRFVLHSLFISHFSTFSPHHKGLVNTCSNTIFLLTAAPTVGHNSWLICVALHYITVNLFHINIHTWTCHEGT